MSELAALVIVIAGCIYIYEHAPGLVHTVVGAGLILAVLIGAFLFIGWILLGVASAVQRSNTVIAKLIREYISPLCERRFFKALRRIFGRSLNYSQRLLGGPGLAFVLLFSIMVGPCYFLVSTPEQKAAVIWTILGAATLCIVLNLISSLTSSGCTCAMVFASSWAIIPFCDSLEGGLRVRFLRSLSFSQLGILLLVFFTPLALTFVAMFRAAGNRRATARTVATKGGSDLL